MYLTSEMGVTVHPDLPSQVHCGTSAPNVHVLDSTIYQVTTSMSILLAAERDSILG